MVMEAAAAVRGVLGMGGFEGRVCGVYGPGGLVLLTWLLRVAAEESVLQSLCCVLILGLRPAWAQCCETP